MSYREILAELDPQQREAATVRANAVVAAGAGSGKTKVLAARYAWLIMEEGCHVDEILTLTFTRKAVTEMYGRIYGLLASCEEPEARRAVGEFYKARVFTIDSYCAGIARTACRRYGISPDFVIDNEGAGDIARQMALPFILEHRRDPALQALTASRKIQEIAEELFAGTILRHSSVCTPLDFAAFKAAQGAEIAEQWRKKTDEAASLIDFIRSELVSITNKTTKAYQALKTALENPVSPPDVRPVLRSHGFMDGGPDGLAEPERDEESGHARGFTAELGAYIAYLSGIKSVSFMGKTSAEMLPLKEAADTLKKSLFADIESLAQFVVQSPVIAGVFPLLDEFQREFSRRKREAGILTFQDVAKLAVDALSRFPDIRQAQKKGIRAIMIDEFQDDNALQRDLLFLLAENEDREEPGIPDPGQLCPGKLFFVGDEKQSIYRFRGADVAVFRRLGRDLSPADGQGRQLRLSTNYRSRPALIHAFNQLFGGLSPAAEDNAVTGAPVFPHESAAGNMKEYEASYSRVFPKPGAEDAAGDAERLVHFCFLDKDNLPGDSPDVAARADRLSADELEAAFTAHRIRTLVDSGTHVTERGPGGAVTRPCRYSDVTILFRTLSRQGLYEKYLRLFGVPYAAESLGGLFTDAPVNDLYSLLRLAVYPQDTNAFAAVLRSPFVRISDEGAAVCLIKNTGIPFDETLDADIPEADREQYRRGRELYASLREDAKSLTAAELITKLWYDTGYRYEALWNGRVQMYGELYDFFFELARQSDMRGKTLTDFLDRVGSLIESGEKIDDLDIPVDRVPGVRLMSIHKSKGLEFPIVFLCGTGVAGKPLRNDEPVYYSDRWGIALNVRTSGRMGIPDGLSNHGALADILSSGGNYFFNTQKEEEALMEAAELRRLLYVAMTRAESELFVTGSLPPRTSGEKEEAEEDGGIRARIAEAVSKKKSSESTSVRTFADLLLPAIHFSADPLFTIEEIPVMGRSDMRRLTDGLRSGGGEEAMYRRAREAVPLYERAHTAEAGARTPDSLSPSSLSIPFQYTAARAATVSNAATADNGAQGELFGEDGGRYARIDAVLEKAGLTAADFGTVAHVYIESRFTGLPPRLPARIHSRLDDSGLAELLRAADLMTEEFFASDLGTRSLAASHRETEFPFLSRIESGGQYYTLTGQIDLVFETKDEVYVVDFKTDTNEDASKHLAQLAAYRHAAAHIFHKPARCWLFYLRSGTGYDVTREVGRVDLPAAAEHAARDAEISFAQRAHG